MNPDNPKKRSSKSSFSIFRLCSMFLFLVAVGVFTWLMNDPVRGSVARHILFGSAFLVFTFGLLAYNLFATRSPKPMAVFLWVCMGVGIILFIIGLFSDHPAPRPVTFDDGTPPSSIVLDE